MCPNKRRASAAKCSKIRCSILLGFVAVVAFVVIYVTFIGRISQRVLLPVKSKNFRSEHIRVPGTVAIERQRLATESVRILFWSTLYGTPMRYNKLLRCGDNACHLTADRSLLDSSHALIFYGWRQDLVSEAFDTKDGKRYEAKGLPETRYKDQYWVFFMLEPPVNFREPMQAFNSLFNWTMGYRKDSDAYLPYGKFQGRKKSFFSLFEAFGEKLLPRKKTKLVAQVLSNCGDVPSRRASLVKALQKHIHVDVYGECGPLKCPPYSTGSKCKDLIGKIYKFYLAFENSLCQDYVTEKFYQALAADMVPVVYGGANYDIIAPRGSYINVNSFPSAKALATYLLFLDENEDEYKKFFEWRREFHIPTAVSYDKGFCSLCNKLYEDYPRERESFYSNITDWLYTSNGRYSVCSEPIRW